VDSQTPREIDHRWCSSHHRSIDQGLNRHLKKHLLRRDWCVAKHLLLVAVPDRNEVRQVESSRAAYVDDASDFVGDDAVLDAKRGLARMAFV
jgi:hypothetical protein